MVDDWEAHEIPATPPKETTSGNSESSSSSSNGSSFVSDRSKDDKKTSEPEHIVTTEPQAAEPQKGKAKVDKKKQAGQAMKKPNNAKGNHSFKKAVPSPPNKKWKKNAGGRKPR